MTMVATLKRLETQADGGLGHYSSGRKVMVNAGLSEMVTQALNLAYSKKNFATGDPFYGEPTGDGNPPPGGSGVPNILVPDSPNKSSIVKPSLEGMQTVVDKGVRVAAAILEEADDMKRMQQEGYVETRPIMAYVVPENGSIPEEMNAEIDAYHDSGAVNINDFVFIFTDSANVTEDVRVVDVNQKVKDYEGRGARVYQSLESFLNDFQSLRQR